MNSKRVTLIATLMAVALGGLYYLYLQGSLNLGFLKNNQTAPVVENQQENVKVAENNKPISTQPIHPLCFGQGFSISDIINVGECNKENEKEPVEKDKDGFF